MGAKGLKVKEYRSGPWRTHTRGRFPYPPSNGFPGGPTGVEGGHGTQPETLPLHPSWKSPGPGRGPNDRMDLWPQRRLDLPIDGSVTMEAGVSGLKTQPLRPPSGPACDQVRAGWRRPLPAVRLMDWVEKAIAAALLLGGVATGIEAGAQPLVLLFLAPNVLFLALVLFRRKPKEIGARAADWVLPIAASAAPQLLVTGSGPGPSPNW